MNKKPPSIALAIASMAVTCAQISADIRIEAVGVPTTVLTSCPEQKPLPCEKFFQYKVFGHFSHLTLGDRAPEQNQPGHAVSKKPTKNSVAQPQSVAASTTGKKTEKAWNRLRILSDRPNSPLDIFHSSELPHASTGATLVTNPVWDATKDTKKPSISIEGNTTNPQGIVVLCVDFIPKPPRPVGSLSITRSGLKAGERAPLAWKISR